MKGMKTKFIIFESTDRAIIFKLWKHILKVLCQVWSVATYILLLESHNQPFRGTLASYPHLTEETKAQRGELTCQRDLTLPNSIPAGWHWPAYGFSAGEMLPPLLVPGHDILLSRGSVRESLALATLFFPASPGLPFPVLPPSPVWNGFSPQGQTRGRDSCLYPLGHQNASIYQMPARHRTVHDQGGHRGGSDVSLAFKRSSLECVVGDTQK